MNGRVAKKIRAMVYGDTSLKIKRKYVRHNKTSAIYNKMDTPRFIYKKIKQTYHFVRGDWEQLFQIYNKVMIKLSS